MAKTIYTVGSLRKALEVIDCFGLQETWSLSELAGRLGMHKATIYRILHTLEEFGYLTKDAEGGRYRMGLRFFALGNLAMTYERLRWQALPPLQDLAEATGETVYVGILYEGNAVCVQVIDGTHAVRMHAFVGKRSPAHASALGKVLLAYMSESTVDDYIRTFGLVRFTPNTIAEPGAFKGEMRRIRARGYAIDDQEMEQGLRCISAPIVDDVGHPIASLSVASPVSRSSLKRLHGLIPAVTDTARQISRMMGASAAGAERRAS